MHAIRGHKALPAPFSNPVLAIGNFDGVHRGHQALLKEAQRVARRQRRAAGVMVFEPHPREFFQPQKPLFRLTPLVLKLKLLDLLDLEFAVVLDFDQALASLEAEVFVRDILVEQLGVTHVVTGYDFHFGKGRQGTPEMLENLGEKFDFGVGIVEAVGEREVSFSSSGVRAALRQGDIGGAARILGYWWRVAGLVEEGASRGADLGFPTANIAAPPAFDLAHGIYAVRVIAPQGRFEGAAYVGRRPTYDETETVIEAFLFDFEGDLYGHGIEIEFIAHLRNDERFDGPQALKYQMARDCEEACGILSRLGRHDPMNRFVLGRNLSLPPGEDGGGG